MRKGGSKAKKKKRRKGGREGEKEKGLVKGD